jgi:hypothetical protein
VLWDTGSPLASTVNLDERTNWKSVPSDLLTLEVDPAKASSDPGYYGREYAFKGDAVVENSYLAAFFLSANGRVALLLKNETGQNGSSGDPSLAREILEFSPVQDKTQRTTITRLQILRNADDEIILQVLFSIRGSSELACVFAFDKTRILEIRPTESVKTVSLISAVEYALLPSFIGDDLIYGPAEYNSADTLYIPAEHVLLGLVSGEESEFVMTWPQGKQQIKLQPGNDNQGKRLIQSIEIDTDGQTLYLSAMSAPGIWHREQLTASYLEKDTPINWKRPFPAKWKTQLTEESTKTTFTFRKSKGQVWRGVPGSYNYPVWFDADDAYYHFSKKVPPKGQSLIYFTEGQDTPLSVLTPEDILKATLGRKMADSILDLPGRKLRTHHRRGGDGVRRACTCGCTEAIQAVFDAGDEVSRKEYIDGALQDMIYFVHRHVDRIDEYRHFADELTKFLREQQTSSPELKPYLQNLEQIIQRIPQEHSLQKENMKSFEYADGLARQTLALSGKKDTNNVKAYMELLKDWRAMGGAQDYVLAQCHTITRKVCQEAGYTCVNNPKAAYLAKEIRRRCRQCLRNPDGYEIWADY